LAGNNNVVKDKDSDLIQYPLQLNRRLDILGGWGTGSAGVIMREEYTVGIEV
jgi:hypothetical protein